MNNLIVVEFSLKQQAFHSESVKEMLENNIKNIFANRTIDYIPIGFFNSNEDANRFINEVYDKFKKSETQLQQDSVVNEAKNILNK